MNATPLAIPDGILLESKVFRDDQVSSSKASIRGNETLLATMRLNTNAASLGTIMPSLFDGLSPASRSFPSKTGKPNPLPQRGISHDPY